ncbi:MAG: AMP-binding protein [Planctomycetes bacterium]|nr:AMP-binding protein [Planctomycetota bacterium]
MRSDRQVRGLGRRDSRHLRGQRRSVRRVDAGIERRRLSRDPAAHPHAGLNDRAIPSRPRRRWCKREPTRGWNGRPRRSRPRSSRGRAVGEDRLERGPDIVVTGRRHTHARAAREPGPLRPRPGSDRRQDSAGPARTSRRRPGSGPAGRRRYRSARSLRAGGRPAPPPPTLRWTRAPTRRSTGWLRPPRTAARRGASRRRAGAVACPGRRPAPGRRGVRGSPAGRARRTATAHAAVGAWPPRAASSAPSRTAASRPLRAHPARHTPATPCATSRRWGAILTRRRQPPRGIGRHPRARWRPTPHRCDSSDAAACSRLPDRRSTASGWGPGPHPRPFPRSTQETALVPRCADSDRRRRAALLPRKTPVSNIGSYEERLRDFDWGIARQVLGWQDGELLNIGHICSDRICARGKGAKTALIWEGFGDRKARYTFDDLRVWSNGFAKLIRDDLGVGVGERVCVFMDKIPSLYFSFLGILKAGAVAQPLFSAFGDESLEVRLKSAGTTAILTTQKHVKKVRKLRERLPALKHVVVVDGDPTKVQPGETYFDVERAPRVEEFESFRAEPESRSVIHYTSGTTGQPKGAQHVHSSIWSQALTTSWVLDLRDDDTYWCTADPGWVTGTSYGIIGPWALGATQAVLDSGFVAERWYRFIQDNRITVWYSAPTAIRSLMREGEELVRKFDLSALRHLASVGEPLNAEAVVWSQKVFDGKPFHDTFWQTETGSIMISNYPGMPVKPGSMGKPFPGITATVLDLKTKEPIREPGRVGLIAFRPGWPAMFRIYWNQEDVYRSKFAGETAGRTPTELRTADDLWYVSGDRASIDPDGYYWFVGRDDDVINTGGHLVGPFEIESALIEHEAIAEAAAIAKPDPVNMEVVKAIVTLKPGFAPSADLELSIMNFIRKRLSPLAMPQEIEFKDKLPKTRSGKILRRYLRALEWGEEAGDLSTLEDD